MNRRTAGAYGPADGLSAYQNMNKGCHLKAGRLTISNEQDTVPLRQITWLEADVDALGTVPLEIGTSTIKLPS